MAKCMKCGGMKYKTGGSTMKTTVGSATPKGQIFGIPNAGSTGPNKQGMDSMKKGGSTGRAIVKKQSGGATKKKETPFQEGVRKKDFTASDTNYVSNYNKSTYSSAPRPANDKAPKTTKGRKDYNGKLDKAYTKTYGSSNITKVASAKRMSTGSWPTKESEYRVTPVSKKKMGGATKKKC